MWQVVSNYPKLHRIRQSTGVTNNSYYASGPLSLTGSPIRTKIINCTCALCAPTNTNIIVKKGPFGKCLSLFSWAVRLPFTGHGPSIYVLMLLGMFSLILHSLMTPKHERRLESFNDCCSLYPRTPYVYLKYRGSVSFLIRLFLQWINLAR